MTTKRRRVVEIPHPNGRGPWGATTTETSERSYEAACQAAEERRVSIARVSRLARIAEIAARRR